MQTNHAQLPRSAATVSPAHGSWSRWGRDRHRVRDGYEANQAFPRQLWPCERTDPGSATNLQDLCVGVRKARAREVVFYKGDPATHMYVVCRGRVKVSAPSEDGKEITFAILGPGEVFGEMGLLDQSEQSVTVTALEPSEIGLFSRDEFQTLLATNPAIAIRLVAILSQRLRKASEMAEDIFFLSLTARLAKKLVELVEAYGEQVDEGVRIGLPLCQQDLANLVGSSRESVNKQLAAWQAQGLLTQRHRRLVIVRPFELSLLTGARPCQVATRA